MMTSVLNDASRYIELHLLECGREQTIKDKVFSFTPKKYFVVHYVIAGQGTFTSRGKSYRLKKGDMFFIAPDELPHYYPDRQDPWTYIWLGFGGYNAYEYLSLSGISQKNPISHDDQTFSIRKLIEEIYAIYNDRGFLDLDTLGLAYQLFAKLIKIGQKDKKTLTAKHRHFNSAKEFILNNYEFDITVLDIARNVGVTPNYLSNIFQTITKMSTITFLNKIRIEKGARLLETTDEPIHRVAKSVGFTAPLYFSNAFKKQMGMSPLHYRNKERV
ncbi:MAG: AraC family transcriptional regulator [Bacilli bacterium]